MGVGALKTIKWEQDYHTHHLNVCVCLCFLLQEITT